MHCRSYKNDCYGMRDCSCECERCLDADEASRYELGDAPDVDAAGHCYSDADPGL